jgi:hypothetical protein
MKQYRLSVVEYGIMNNNWQGWKMGRIEVLAEDEPYAVYEGSIRLPEKAFDALREELDEVRFTEDKMPYMNFNMGSPK